MLVYRLSADGGHPSIGGRRQGQRSGTLTPEAVNAGWRLYSLLKAGVSSCKMAAAATFFSDIRIRHA
jgi:hypothetical protein